MNAAGGAATPSTLADAVDRVVLSVARHWLAVLVSYGAVITALPVIAPLLKSAGYSSLSSPIYFLYQFICHQREDRSLHIHGEQMAFCVRDLSIFGGAVCIALAFRLIPTFAKAAPPGLWIALIALVPIGIDGVTQLLGFRESTQVLRIATGLMFSIGIGGYVLPRLDVGFRMLESDIAARLSTQPEHSTASAHRRA